MGKKEQVLGLAKYNISDWKRLLKISDDRDRLETTWEEWNNNYQKYIDKIRKENILFEEILVDLDELEIFCNFNKLKIDGDSRSQFVVYKLMEM